MWTLARQEKKKGKGKKRREGAKEVKVEGGAEGGGAGPNAERAKGRQNRRVASCFCFVLVDWDFLIKFPIKSVHGENTRQSPLWRNKFNPKRRK